MTIVYRTQDEPAASRLDRWREVVERTPIPLAGRPADAQGFRGEIHAGTLGAVRVEDVTVPGGECFRTPALIRQSDPGYYTVDVIAHGQTRVEQDGRQAHLAPGDLTFLDSSRPVRYAHPRVRHVAVMFPRTLLPLPAAAAARLTAVHIRGDEGMGALVSSLALKMPEHLDGYPAADGARLGTAVVDLLSALLAARLGRASALPDDARRRALLLRIHAFIERRLPDPGLTPASIAAAHHISLRYLYKLFEREQASVADWVRQRRLQRCRHDLLDPAQRAKPVSAIAARWGFPNPAHFSRLFRAAYGTTPGEFRAMGGHGRPAAPR
ncbi:MAG TPA: helix-turn-helix domain-containing protein [Streptosporangiaceae bacterium]|jgi:AraC-like DNA-binding protein